MGSEHEKNYFGKFWLLVAIILLYQQSLYQTDAIWQKKMWEVLINTNLWKKISANIPQNYTEVFQPKNKQF